MSFGIPVRNGLSIGLLASTFLTSGSGRLVPRLTLNFLTGAPLDSRITFTRTTTATFVGSNGLIQSAAINGPRFDYNPVTLAPRGLLIEEQRVNSLLYSEQLDNVVWTKAGSTITANATTSPDGTVNADKLVENAALSTQHRIQQAVTTAIGTSYTYTAYLKAGERTVVTMRIIGTSTFAGCTINLTAGTISAITGAATITNAGNGWYRVSVTGTADSILGTCYVNLTDGSSITYTGDGVSGAFVWGAQIEAGAFATSYIPTVASTVTRAADVAVMTGTNFSSWYNASEGTIVFSGDSSRPVGSSPATRVFQFDDGTTNNNIRSAGTATLQVVDAAVVQANITPTPAIPFDGTVFKFASAYKVNDFATVTTGAVGTDTSGTVPTVTQLSLGGSSLAGGLINGHIRTFTFYATRLTNAQLQALTA